MNNAKIDHEPMKILTVNLPVEYLKILIEHKIFNYASKSEFIREGFKLLLIKELELRGLLRDCSYNHVIDTVKNLDISNPFQKGKSKKIPLGNKYYPSALDGEEVSYR